MKKKCTKCGEEKELGEFYKNKGCSDGLSSWCKRCAYAASRAWCKNNIDKVKEHEKKRRYKHRDKLLQSKKKWYEENKDRNCLMVRKWIESNKEKKKEYDYKYNKKAREALLDSYIKKILEQTGVNRELLNEYPTIIELKRLELKTKRELKNHKL